MKKTFGGQSFYKKYYNRRRLKKPEDSDSDDDRGKVEERYYRSENLIRNNNEVLVQKEDGSIVITREFVTDSTTFVLDPDIEFDNRQVPKKVDLLIDNISIITSNPNFEQYLPLKISLFNNQEIEIGGGDGLQVIPKYGLAQSSVLKTVINNLYDKTNVFKVNDNPDFNDSISHDMVQVGDSVFIYQSDGDRTTDRRLWEYNTALGTLENILPEVPNPPYLVTGDRDACYILMTFGNESGGVFNAITDTTYDLYDTGLDPFQLELYINSFDLKIGYLTVNNIIVFGGDVDGVTVEISNKNEFIYGFNFLHTDLEPSNPDSINRIIIVPILENSRTVPNNFIGIYAIGGKTFKFTFDFKNGEVTNVVKSERDLEIILQEYDTEPLFKNQLFANTDQIYIVTDTKLTATPNTNDTTINIFDKQDALLFSNTYKTYANTLVKQYRNLVYLQDTTDKLIYTFNLSNGEVSSTTANELAGFSNIVNINENNFTLLKDRQISSISNTRDREFYRVNQAYDGRKLEFKMNGASRLNLKLRSFEQQSNQITQQGLPLSELEIIKLTIDFRVNYSKQQRRTFKLKEADREKPLDPTGYLDQPKIPEKKTGLDIMSSYL